MARMYTTTWSAPHLVQTASVSFSQRPRIASASEPGKFAFPASDSLLRFGLSMDQRNGVISHEEDG